MENLAKNPIQIYFLVSAEIEPKVRSRTMMKIQKTVDDSLDNSTPQAGYISSDGTKEPLNISENFKYYI